MDHHKTHAEQVSADILVVGAGISGITAALEAAETGFSVLLIEKNPYIGGRVAQLNNYFPKMCPPTCGLEINIRRLRENANITLLTLAEVETIEGVAGNFTVKLKQKPRYVNNRCTVCGDCIEACPEYRSNEFNLGIDKSKAIYSPYNNSYPAKYVIDAAACKFDKCEQCLSVCKYKAIDLTEKPRHIEAAVKSIVVAAGWKPYNAKNLDTLGYGEFPNVLTNVEIERYASASGPTGGKIINPAGGDIKTVVFVQCAGSRDENHLEYCSSICCLASMKQAQYVREQYPDSEVHIFYIDLRSPGIFEEFYANTKKDDRIHFHRGKVAKVFKNAENGKLLVEAENTLAGELKQMEADLVILATGMEPVATGVAGLDKSLLDNNGFVKTNINGGITGCGVCTRPKDVAATVQEATGAALKAIHTVMEGK